VDRNLTLHDSGFYSLLRLALEFPGGERREAMGGILLVKWNIVSYVQRRRGNT